jgi:hypothetical protein
MDKKGPLNQPEPVSSDSDKQVSPALSKNLSQRILQNISKSYTGEDTSKFIVHLGETLHPQSVEEPALKPEDDRELRTPALAFLDRLFDDFSRYGFEFATTAAGSEVKVECTRPMPPKDSVKVAPGEPPVLLEGTLHFGSWTMLLQAQERRVRAFVIPKEYLAGFHARQSFYASFVEMLASIHNGQTVWRIDEQRLSPEDLAKLSKQLFTALAKVNAGELSPSDRFQLDGGENQSIARLLPGKSEKLALQSLPTMRVFSTEKDTKVSVKEESKSSIRSGYVLELEANKAAVLSSCQSLVHSLENELNRLSRIEREGFRQEDMKIVEQALSRAGQLRALIEQIKLAADTWQQLPSSEGERKR